MISNLRLLFVTSLLMLSCMEVSAQVAGPNNPGLVINNGILNAWTNPMNATTLNSTYTTNANRGITSKLRASAYNFTLLPTDVVNGIQLDVNRNQLPGPDITRLVNWTERGGEGISNFTITPGNERILMVVIGAENAPAPLTYSVSYNGVSLTKATSISVTSPSTFNALLDIWYLKDINMPAGLSTANIVVTGSGTVNNEYFSSTSAAVYQNVDQTNPFQSFISGTSTSGTATFQIPTAMTNAAGAMAFTAIFCGNNRTPAATNGNTNCWSINQGFTERVDVYRANTTTAPNTGGCVQIADKAYTTAATDQPTFTFAGTPNRRCALAVSFRRSSIYDNSVRLIKNGLEVGANYALSTVSWPQSAAYQSYGGPSDLWGTTWTSAEVNNLNFGGVFAANVDQGTAQLDHIRMLVFFSSTLPIDLVDFTVLREDNKNKLSWVTATEINSSNFEIEKSIDGFEFITIESITAAGTSTEVKFYETQDERQSADVVYYRLKMVDKDGTFKYSDIKSIEGQANALGIFPNPVLTWAHVLSSNEAENVQILDASGRVVSNPEYYFENGQLRINTEALNDGQYYLLVKEEGKNKLLHFIKN